MSLQPDQHLQSSPSLVRLLATRKLLRENLSSAHRVSFWEEYWNTTTFIWKELSERTLAFAVRKAMQHLLPPQSLRVDRGYYWNSRSVEFSKSWPSETPQPNHFSARLASQSSGWDLATEVTISLEFELSPQSTLQRAFAKEINSLTSSLTSPR